MCLYSKIVENKKFTETKKNGGVIPAVNDRRTLYVPTGCGKCMECRKQYSREWQARLHEDIKTNKNGVFITLTLSTEALRELNAKVEYDRMMMSSAEREKNIWQHEWDGYKRDNEIITKAVRLFNERWRKKTGKAPRHWLVSELGHKNTEHIHMHGIIWTDDYKMIKDKWQYGYVWDGYTKNGKRINYVNGETIGYMTKYITKTDLIHKTYKAIILSSNGIGADYVNTYNAKLNRYKETGETNQTYRLESGHKIALPKYWRNKIYTDEEKEKLWIEMLDREIRYIDGQKIDVSKGVEEYYKLLEEAREKNKKLNYGSDAKNWNRVVYERERRKLIRAARIEC